jgi:hypothetical protein
VSDREALFDRASSPGSPQSTLTRLRANTAVETCHHKLLISFSSLWCVSKETPRRQRPRRDLVRDSAPPLRPLRLCGEVAFAGYSSRKSWLTPFQGITQSDTAVFSVANHSSAQVRVHRRDAEETEAAQRPGSGLCAPSAASASLRLCGEVAFAGYSSRKIVAYPVSRNYPIGHSRLQLGPMRQLKADL